jgi:hypothetical protein
VGSDESTPSEMAEHDLAEARRETADAQTQFAIEKGNIAIANLMGVAGAEDAMWDAVDRAEDAHQAGAVDAQQAIHWTTAATHWQEAASDLQQQAQAQGGAYVADAQATAAEDRLHHGELDEREKTKAEVEAARSRAEEGALDRRAHELGDAAHQEAERAEFAEKMAHDLD